MSSGIKKAERNIILIGSMIHLSLQATAILTTFQAGGRPNSKTVMTGKHYQISTTIAGACTSANTVGNNGRKTELPEWCI